MILLDDLLKNSYGTVFIILVIIIIILLLFIFIFILKRNTKIFKKINANKAYQRQIKLNLNDGTYSYLNMKKPNKIICRQLSEFYGTFNIQDQETVKQWVNSFINPNNKQNTTLEKYVLEKKKRDYIFASFKHIKTNYLDKTVYLKESIYPLIKKQSFLKTNNTSFINNVDISNYLDNVKKSNKKELCIIALHLYQTSVFNKNNDDLINIQLLKVLNTFLYKHPKKKFLYSMYDESTLNIIMLKSKSEKNVMTYINSLMKIIYDQLSLNNLLSSIDYSIGIYFKKEYEDDLLISKAKRAYQTAIFTKNSSSKIKYSFYNSDVFENESYNESLKKEAIKIIKNNDLIANYTSYVQINNSSNNSIKTKGFIYSVNPKSSIITDINQFEKIVYEANETYSYLKQSMFNFVNDFQSQSIKKNTIKSIIFRIEPQFINNVLNFFKYNKIEDISITFLFNEDYFINSNYDILQIKNDFNKIKQLGYNVSINIENFKSNIQSEVLSLFDLFVIDEELISKLSKDTRINILIKSLIKDLQRFKTPILACGIKTSSAFELLSSYGVTYFSGDIIAKPSDTIQEVDKNISSKLQNLLK